MSRQITTETTALQAVTGIKFRRPSDCQVCGTELSNGDPVVAYASQPVDAAQWTIHQLYCPDCVPSLTGTQGVYDLLVRGWLVAQRPSRDKPTQLSLTCGSIVAWSPPTQDSADDQ